MNILYVNHYAGSPALGMEYRPFYLAREWVRLGHCVQMLAADFSHVRSRQPAAGDQLIDGIQYRWYATPGYEGNGVARARNIWSFLRAVWADSPRLVADFKPDVVIASSTYPMDIWVARRIARSAGAKLVFEVHDLWPLSPIELSGMFHRHPFAVLCQHAEDEAYRHADVVVSMLPKVHAHMASRGLDLSKLHIVPNGIALDEWQADPEPLRDDVAAALASARAGGRVVVGYAGSMGRPNALDDLLDAAELLRDEAFSFVLVGGGHEQARLAQRVAQAVQVSGAQAEHGAGVKAAHSAGVQATHGARAKAAHGAGVQAALSAVGQPQVQMLPAVPKSQVPAFLAALDIAYIGWQRMPLYRFGIAPNKLMDYMMARCPVLHAVEAGNDPVAEAGAGISVAPESAVAVAEGLRRLAAVPSAEG